MAAEDAPLHVTTWSDGPGPAEARAVLVHGTMTWGTESFAEQRPLARRFRVDVLDRRGYGGSPDTARSDYEADADDIAEVLSRTPGGAHLVGHSYGGVSAMFAAARHPHLVHSLTLIEPAAMRAAEADPEVAEALTRMRAAFGSVPRNLSAEQYLTVSTEPYGLPVPEFTPWRLRATRTAMGERPAWEAEIPLAPLAAGGFPKLVINGTWETADPEHRAFNGDAMAACGRTVAALIAARHTVVPATAHDPHRDHPAEVNRLLADLWSRRDA
ncbi:Lysophospholipase, alpha-beta hydrolase superfamily [Actinacidiphila rubida]|uniref:Lysophospholipase, alpha-beta hydrolase superfamily n=2 Tax=Actinacidiphila rubida TaxID=310780 RepID=A0A1H8Q7V8_9ACTN|nr:alpha/beta hydrolase [Actinacidiphila rubida]SEO50118.1 Lysophospholipase, alpha-beta hydrolase superfamily [Actinacidiphila rubida]